jgi:hypothetical protein
MSTLQSGSHATPALAAPESPSESPSAAPLVLAMLVALTLLGGGAVAAARGQGVVLLTGGAVALVAALAAWSLRGANANASDLAQAGTAADPHLAHRLEQIESLLRTLTEQQLLSDRAKAVAFREKDREALRRAIREDMARNDWDAALVLANSMEREFGYVQEAGALRTEIRRNQLEAVQKQVAAAVAVIDSHTRAEQWTQALREADRLQQIYPDNESVKRLPHDIEARRQAHKKQLCDSWEDAVARKDVDGSIEVLKRLDPYLTPAEAEKMQESARGIFKEKITQLKNQYSQAALNSDVSEAERIGAIIIRDFPNSRLAAEVRETIGTLRQRAAARSAEVART